MIQSNKDFMKKLTYIAIPITIQSIIQCSLSMIDQLMVGKLGETAINAVGLGTKLSFIFLLTLAGITSATSIYASQFWGGGEKKKIAGVLGITLSYASIIALLTIILSILCPQFIMSLFIKDTAVISLGADYMRIIALGLLPLVIVNSFASVLRSCGDAKTPMITGFVSVILNTLLNYILIFGMAGISGMGVKGAAIATTISRLVECMLILYLFHRKNLLKLKIKDYFKFNKKLVSLFTITMLPLLLNEALWGIGDSVFSAIYGRIGGMQTAAMMSTFPIQGLSFGLMSGIGAASGIMIGNLLGEGKNDEAYSYGKKFIKLGIMFAVIIGILISLLGSYYIDLMKISPESKEYACKILNVFSLVLWIKVSNMIIAGGILRSGGNTKIILALEMAGTWCIGIPLGIVVSKYTNLPIQWVYFFISSEELFRMVVGLKLFTNRTWMSNMNASLEEAI
ncbi:MATE family efflux transporter [Oceanirhabdus sp. W0125-5]|uniref:MATE family efflux transporter n=1 Tax=Oceanirhabdus sp. W0125-5 TaxID=2999116 RepID=UPI0022F2F2A1|nr:MATE family efflux transporter [Oceanirhabdus sp. W0125-5]WBW99791.1 MATE family efflux transporter [Oceanirhabdus sp. W0125-5]